MTEPQKQTHISSSHTLEEAEETIARLERVTEELTRTMEKTRIAEYVQYLHQPLY